jgi:hypothetical protein
MEAEAEDKHLRHVETALLQLLNDDIDEANRILKEHESSYHYLGRGISSFLSSMLGGEKEMVKEALSKLLASENKNWEDMKKAQKDDTAYRSKIYPAGTEYLLCYVGKFSYLLIALAPELTLLVSQLTSAICGVMSGSVTEAIKGFYKLRKAFQTLDGILQVESEYLKHRVGNTSRTSLRGPPPTSINPNKVRISHDLGPNDEKNDQNVNEGSNLSDLDEYEVVDSEPASGTPLDAYMVQSRLLEIDPASVGITSHTDIFIHSGVRLCYGMLLIIFSMVENPLFTKILYIVGFKGDRERGARYLWQATRFDNFNSAIAGIALLGYYNGLVGFSDILPTDPGAEDDLTGYPKEKCRALLKDMRSRYPDSKLWRMEEARMQGFDRRLDIAIKMLEANSESKMKQIAAINLFEMSFTSMFMHDYQLSVKCWDKCAAVSKWSPAMYAYQSGISHLELYREYRLTDPVRAKKEKELAEKYIRKAPPLAGKQKVMSKELPFDTFITRKVQKWEERAKKWKVDLADATGTSPFAEMIYLWNGSRKQNKEELEKSLECVAWERTTHPEKFETDVDERAVCALVTASVWKNMGEYEEARVILEIDVLRHDR